MGKLVKTELFNLLIDNSQKATNEEMKNAYESFVGEVETLNQSDRDYPSIYRLLNLTCIEFRCLETLHQYEQEKKCP